VDAAAYSYSAMATSLNWNGVENAAQMAKSSRKRKRALASDDDDDLPSIPLPMLMGGRGATSVYANHNCIFFNDDINNDTVFALNKELRSVADKLTVLGTIHKSPPPPIWLHITTNGGDIYAAFSVIDCITHLGVPVYTVVDGFCASAGTLISIVGAKRYILPNAYMLLHELRSNFWGKFSDITDEITNLQKIMNHITGLYTKHTSIPKRTLEKLLKKDIVWNADECLTHGVVDAVFDGYATYKA